MTRKDPEMKGPRKLGPEQEAEILRRMDTVRFPMPRLPAISTESTLREVRFVRRVMRWAQAHSAEDVAERLAWVLIERREWRNQSADWCELNARQNAETQLKKRLNRLGKGCRHWPAVRKEWKKFRADPSRYDGSKGFAAAMEAKFPGVAAGTLSNKITQWKREQDSQNGES